MFCYEENRGITLHAFRSRLGYSQINNYRNIYNVNNGQFENKKILKNITDLDTTLENSIKEFLNKNPGNKARKIATALKLDKKDVNHYLYGKLKNECKRDGDFRWYLKNDLDRIKQQSHQNTKEILENAVSDHKSIHMSYKGFRRTVNPYSVNNTYCVGFCTYRNDLRTFRIDRMKSISTGEKFEFKSSLSRKAPEQAGKAQYYRR